MRQMFFMGIKIVIGFFLMPEINIPQWVLMSLLAIGLYGATAGINISELKLIRGSVFNAITGGVLFKAFFVGCILWLVTQEASMFLVGVILAQIDPISTAKLTQETTLSERGKSFLNAWASFDDPMTVLLAFYAIGPLLLQQTTSMTSYFTGLAFSLGIAGLCFFLSKLCKHNLLQWALLITTTSICIHLEAMLGIALVGLFLRPAQIDSLVPKAVDGAYYLALVIMGMMLATSLITSKNIIMGIIAGILIVAAHFIVSVLLQKTKSPLLKKSDWKKIQFAQYNGITSTLLVLSFAGSFPELVPIVFFSIITVAFCYHTLNK